MATLPKPIFMRPIEITGDTDSITITPNGGTPTAVTINTGVYSSIQAVLYAFETKANSVVGDGVTDIDFGLYDTDGEVNVRVVFVGNTAKIIFSGDTGPLLGFNYSNSYIATHTGLYRPDSVWLPGYQVANQGRFQPKQKDLFAGAQAKNGALAGTTTGATIYYRKLRFENEQAYNLMEEGITANTRDDGRYDLLHLDYFAKEARTCQTSVADLPSKRGFWFWPDWQDAIDNPDTMPGGTDGDTDTYNGINFDLDTDPDLFAFCQFAPAGFRMPQSVDAPTGRVYYHVDFEIHTVDTVPTWADPDHTVED